MSDAIKPPGAPGSAEDVAGRPDVGFHDDHVGGHLKAEEAAKRRAALGVAKRRSKRLEAEPRQVGAVRHNRAAQQEDRAAQELKRQQRGLVQGKGPQRNPPKRPQGPTAAIEEDVRRLGGRIDLLMGTLSALEGVAYPSGADAEAADRAAEQAGEEAAELVRRVHRHHDEDGRGDRHATRPEPTDADDAEGGQEAQKAQDGLAAPADPEARWQKTARDMRFLLQHLIAGGVGLSLAPDPATTFAQLFADLAQWPARVPPGHRPASDADYDAFLRWVFRPEDGHLDAAEEQAAMPPPPPVR